MIRRLFWAALGATVGVLVVRKLSRTARAFTPAGVSSQLSDTVGTVAEAIRDFAADVRDAMDQREQELREGMGLDGKVGAKPEEFQDR
ncbi:MAG TPA: hypothetical protein VIR27_21900 [Mycobacteriales bacterium]